MTAAVYTGPLDDDDKPTRGINVMLEGLRALAFDDQLMQITAQAGCNLGVDPKDPTGVSRLENGFFKRLDDRGWAVPDMGGIIHQSIGGFLSTGSAGGSLQNSIYDSIVAVRLVDGTGQVHVLERPADDADPDHPFFGTIPSMGLLGIITAVTFQCIPKYHVKGDENVYPVSNAPFESFAGGQEGLEQYLRDIEHVRILWWPQTGVDKLVVWTAERMEAADYTEQTGTFEDFKAKPYHLLEPILGSRTLTERLANDVYEFFARLNPPLPENAFEQFLDNVVAPLFPLVINGFLESTGEDGRREFWDTWWQALPMDNEADDDLLEMEFTEAWIPIEHTPAVMAALRDHYQAGGFAATGTNACEIYAAKASPFWMSPAHAKDVLRIDLFWYGKNEGDPSVVYYPQFWELFGQFEPRYHWGKYLPVDPAKLKTRFTKWDAFLQLRAQFDPDQIFLTDYWRERLGVA